MRVLQRHRLEVRHLDIAYRRPDGVLRPAVVDACFSLDEGQSLGIVGESGSGKSTLARALLGYTRPGGVITGGTVIIDGREIGALSRDGLLALRGGRIAFVPQNPLSSLTPHIRVGPQVAEAVRIHRRCDATAAKEATLELFAATNLPDPQALYDRLCEQAGTHVDRCMLYVFRCAVYYASEFPRDPRLLLQGLAWPSGRRSSRTPSSGAN